MSADSVAFRIIKDLWCLNRNFCSTDYDASLDYINTILPLKIYRFDPVDEFNGWIIPPKWDLVKATIKYNKKLIFEADHPLHVIGLSSPVHQFVSREELRKHLHYDRRDPHSVPYHFRQNYRPWERDWGFCVTQEFYDSLQSGGYEVQIITKESEGYLKVAEYTHQGSHPETFVMVAHLDHPGMANDDLAGVAVGVELFRRLLKIPTKFTYRLVLVQEIIGSVFYLGKEPSTRQNVMESCFLEMLGSGTELAFQRSRHGQSLMEKKLEKALSEKHCKFRTGPFRSIICNDEPVWESYGIPMSSLSRFPYPEYHSDKDNPDIIRPESLEESVEVLMALVQELDKATLMRKKFEGIPALSNPIYDLYVDPGQPAFGTVAEDKIKRLRLLMDLLPMYPKEIFVETMADEVQMTQGEVLEYLQRWKLKNLIQLV